MTQVSYIVAVDNQCSCLDALLKGLRGQEGDFSREFVFVDDGSDDGSFDALIARTRCWPRTLLIQQRRQGPTAAALTGAKAATGDVWLFLDGDAVPSPWATRTLLAALRDGELDMILAAQATAETPGDFDFGAPPEALEASPLADAAHALLASPRPYRARMMMRRALFRDPGFFAAGVYLPDFAPPLHAALKGRVGIVDAPLFAVPPDAPSRTRRADGQAEHDFSASVAAFVAAHPELSARCRRVALAGAARRALRQARVRRRAGLTARFFWLYIKALLGVPTDVAAALTDSLSAWDDAPIRRPAAKT